jgi:hypothetical protein
MAFRRRLTLLTIATTSTLLLLLVAALTALASPAENGGGWAPPKEVSQSGGSTSLGPSLALEDDGTLHAVWMERDPVFFTVFPAKSTDRGTNWSYSVPLTPAGTSRFEGAMDMDEYGGLHIVWTEQQHELWYGQLVDTGWADHAMISAAEFITLEVVGPDVEVAGDWIHAVWSEKTLGAGGTSKFDLFYSRSEAGELWSPPVLAADTGQTSKDLSLASDSNDNIHVVWYENTHPAEILYISGTVYVTDTVWSVPVTVSVGLDQSAATPSVAVGDDDVVHVLFGVDVESQPNVQDVYYAGFHLGATGSISPVLIPDSRVNIFQLLPTFASPDVALYGTDEIHAAWNGMKVGDYSDRVYYAVSEDGGSTWSEPLPVTPRDTRPDVFPSLATDGELVYVLFQEGSSADKDILLARRFPLRFIHPLAANG